MITSKLYTFHDSFNKVNIVKVKEKNNNKTSKY